MLSNSLFGLKCVLQELLELPYIIWTEKPENITQWSFKPKTWLGKLEDFQDPRQSTSRWLTSMTTPRGFLRVCTCFFHLHVLLFIYVKQNEVPKYIMSCYCCHKWAHFVFVLSGLPYKTKDITPPVVSWTW